MIHHLVPAFLVVATIASATVQAQPARALFLLDRSGSMTLGLPTRCDKSEQQAKDDIDFFFAIFPTGQVTVREFTSAIPSRARWIGASEWHGNAASARAAVDTAIACGGLTPLADAICDSAQAIAVAAPSAECYIHIYSDGGENDSQGACSGGSATNALTGRCADDFLQPGLPFATDSGGNLSWQQRACTTLGNLAAGCDFVLNVYKFGDFSTDVSDPAFVFMDSASRASGGLRVEVDDSLRNPPGGALRIDPTVGCRDANGALPYLTTVGLPSLGQRFSIGLVAPSGRTRYILMGIQNFQRPIDLGLIGAPGCGLKVDALVIVRTPLLPLQIPMDRGLLGASLEFQGIATDPQFASTPWLLTTNALTARIQ